MIQSGTLAPTHIRHVMKDGKSTLQTMILNPEDGAPGPYVFLVEQEPNCVIGAHYHNSSQFQLAVDGEGRLGRHKLRPLGVHYTERHTGYGPIIAGEAGLSYLTLRPIKDISGAQWLPENNRKIDRAGKRRQVTVDATPPSSLAELRARTEIAIETVIEADDAGLASWFVHMPPRATVASPRQPPGLGQFHVVISGTMNVDGRSLPQLSTTWVPAEAKHFEICAGDDGLEVIVLQFPLGSFIPSA